ncbi:MAG: cupin domain-containing protein [Syntrophus sp. (in: bacteria)]
MILFKDDAVNKSFHGVDFAVLACGLESMVTKMLYKASDYVPSHSHPNEQSGYVISGEYRITIHGETQAISAGDSYSIPRDIEHSIDIVVPGQIIDVFTPPRADYL